MNVNHEESEYVIMFQSKKLYCLRLTPISFLLAVKVQATVHACLLPSVSSHFFLTYLTPKHLLVCFIKCIPL